MALVEESKTYLPLRQTCNRCRELKVRCKARQPNIFTGNKSGLDDPVGAASACLRCSRAGAVCAYSLKQRSGRPHKQRQQSYSSSSPSAALEQAFPPSVQNSSVESFAGITPPREDLWSNSSFNQPSSDEFATLLDDCHFSNLQDDSSGCEPLAPIPEGSMSHHGAMMPPSPVRSANTPTSDGSASVVESMQHQFQLQQFDTKAGNDMIVKNMTEMMELNLRIFRVSETQATTAAPPTPSICDELTSITLSLLKIMIEQADKIRSRKAENHQGQHIHHKRHQSLLSPSISGNPSPQQTGESLDAQLRRQTLDSSLCFDDNSCTADALNHYNGIDTSTIMLVLACYMRLIDLFKYLCLAIERQVAGHSTASSTAQVIMSTELVSHLLGRLDRGLVQLISQIQPPPTSSLSTPFSRIGYATDSNCGLAPYEEFCNVHQVRTGLTNQNPHSSSDGSNSSLPNFQSIMFVICAMSRSQAALGAHIDGLKNLIQRSD